MSNPRCTWRATRPPPPGTWSRTPASSAWAWSPTCWTGRSSSSSALALYILLKPCTRASPAAMLVLVILATAITCLSALFEFEGLRIATGAVDLGSFGAAGSNAVVLLMLDAQHYGLLVAQIFFGLWLAPLGYLAYRSGWFPRALGLVLIAACASYLVDLLFAFLLPDVGQGNPWLPGHPAGNRRTSDGPVPAGDRRLDRQAENRAHPPGRLTTIARRNGAGSFPAPSRVHANRGALHEKASTLDESPSHTRCHAHRFVEVPKELPVPPPARPGHCSLCGLASVSDPCTLCGLEHARRVVNERAREQRRRVRVAQEQLA